MDQPTVSAPPTAGGPEPKKKGKVFKIIGAIVVVFVALFAFIWMSTGPIAEEAETQLSLIKAGDLSIAYNDTSQAFQKMVTLEEYENFVAEFPVLQDYESVSFNYRDVQNSAGYVEGTITQTDGTVYPIRVDLVHENDEWKVYGINIGNSEYENDAGGDMKGTEIATVYQLKTSVDLAEDGSLIDPKDVFSPDEKITFSGFISTLPAGATMIGTMYDGEGDEYYSTAIEFEEGGYDAQFYFFVDPQNSDIPVDDYMLEVMFDHESFKEPVFGFEFISVE
ncbi:hypothetical protein C0581_00545 [Candidatus Parcubacteria bacterium]|nr:MAG: hypothetical protein C0581_00545 [Candidatus Parcubacteria bacterium]